MIQIHKMRGSLLSLGAACTAFDLKEYYDNKVSKDNNWKSDHPDLVDVDGQKTPIVQVLADLHAVSDIVVLECVAIAAEYKSKALRVKCSKFSKDWRAFCLDQLSKNVGARILHRYTNRHSLAQAVPLFKPGGKAKTPNQAVEADACHWKQFWQNVSNKNQAFEVLSKLRNDCQSSLRLESASNFADMAKFTSKQLFNSAKRYKKNSKGSDHWLASEFLLPDDVLGPIASAIDFSVCSLAWAQQLLLVMHVYWRLQDHSQDPQSPSVMGQRT